MCTCMFIYIYTCACTCSYTHICMYDYVCSMFYIIYMFVLVELLSHRILLHIAQPTAAFCCTLGSLLRPSMAGLGIAISLCDTAQWSSGDHRSQWVMVNGKISFNWRC